LENWENVYCVVKLPGFVIVVLWVNILYWEGLATDSILNVCINTVRLYAQQKCVYSQHLLLSNQDTAAILQNSHVFIMEYVWSNLLLVLNCRFWDLALKISERLSGEEEERERKKNQSNDFPSENIVSLESQYFTKVWCLCLH